MFTVTDSVANKGSAASRSSPYGRVTRLGEPPTSGYYILHEGLVGVIGDKGLQEYKYKDIQKDHEVTWSDKTGGWLGITDKYWAAALIPEQTQVYTARYIGTEERHHAGLPDRFHRRRRHPGARRHGHPDHPPVRRRQAGERALRLPRQARHREIRPADRLGLVLLHHQADVLPDRLVLSSVFGNFGVAILLVTVMVKAVFFPLANKSYKSMSQMKKLQPQMAALREQYKDDKVKQQEELMELYKTEKINPLAGCWPMVIQIPVFFSLYKVLFVTIEMRHAPFFGWIHDLSAPDPTHIFNLFGLLPYDPSTVPMIGHFLAIGIWPLIMGITMFVQMRLNPTPPDPTQAMMFTWMPVIFTFMLASFPAGLVIYWAWNNTLSVTQQYIIMRRQGAR